MCYNYVFNKSKIGTIINMELRMLLSHVSPELAVGVLLFMLTWRASSNINKTIADHQAQEKRQNDLIELLGKQQCKIISVINASPCITKENGLWLANVKKNGGSPPDKIRCLFQEAKHEDEG